MLAGHTESQFITLRADVGTDGKLREGVVGL